MIASPKEIGRGGACVMPSKNLSFMPTNVIPEGFSSKGVICRLATESQRPLWTKRSCPKRAHRDGFVRKLLTGNTLNTVFFRVSRNGETRKAPPSMEQTNALALQFRHGPGAGVDGFLFRGFQRIQVKVPMILTHRKVG